MCSVVFDTSASGVKTNGVWDWEKPRWENCDCGMCHSNRKIPSAFWKQDWDKRKGGKNSAGFLLWKASDLGEVKIFLVQSYGNFFGIPKGHLDPGETFFEGALREFQEETGKLLDVSERECFEIRKTIGNDRTSIYSVRVPWYFEIRTTPQSDVEISSFGFAAKKAISGFKLNKLTKDIFETMRSMGNEF
jgi:ADP-ribose pyrophosphatase YjhB (NUDIX family)